MSVCGALSLPPGVRYWNFRRRAWVAEIDPEFSVDLTLMSIANSYPSPIRLGVRVRSDGCHSGCFDQASTDYANHVACRDDAHGKFVLDDEANWCAVGPVDS